MENQIREMLRRDAASLSLPPETWNQISRRLWEERPRPVWEELLRRAKKSLLPSFLFLALTLAGCTSGSAVRVTQSALTVEEYPIVEQKVDRPGHFEYNDRISKEILAKRSAWRGQRLHLEQANRALSSLGYRVEQSGDRYTLLKGDRAVAMNLLHFSPVAVNAKGDSFIFGADTERESLLFGPDGGRPWNPDECLYQRPVFAGNDLVMVRAKGEKQDGFEVLRGDKVVYTGSMPPVGASIPLKRLAAWDGKWVVEVDHQVIVEGKSLNQETGYDQIFEWQLIGGKPFYFYKDGRKYGAAYDGKPVGVTYDEIMHYGCCEPAAFNPGGNGTMVVFHARQGDMWYYVEMGKYE